MVYDNILNVSVARESFRSDTVSGFRSVRAGLIHSKDRCGVGVTRFESVFDNIIIIIITI